MVRTMRFFTEKLWIWSTTDEIFVGFLSFLQLKTWTSFIKFCCYLHQLHETIIWQTQFYMNGNKYTKLFKCGFSFLWNQAESHLWWHLQEWIQHLWSWREVCRPVIPHLAGGPVWHLKLAATSEDYLLLILSPQQSSHLLTCLVLLSKILSWTLSLDL